MFGKKLNIIKLDWVNKTIIIPVINCSILFNNEKLDESKKKK